jgi:hypothetical protein
MHQLFAKNMQTWNAMGKNGCLGYLIGGHVKVAPTSPNSKRAYKSREVY